MTNKPDTAYEKGKWAKKLANFDYISVEVFY